MSGGSNAGDRIHRASGVPSAWQDVTTLLGAPGSSAIRRGSHGHTSLFPLPRPNTGDPSSPGSPSFLHILPHPVPRALHPIDAAICVSPPCPSNTLAPLKFTAEEHTPHCPPRRAGTRAPHHVLMTSPPWLNCDPQKCTCCSPNSRDLTLYRGEEVYMRSLGWPQSNRTVSS